MDYEKKVFYDREIIVPPISIPSKKIKVAVYGLKEESVGFIASLLKQDNIEVVQLFSEGVDPYDLAARIYKSLLVNREDVSVHGNTVSLREEVFIGREISVNGEIIRLPDSLEDKKIIKIVRDLKMEVSLVSSPQEAAEKLCKDVEVVFFAEEGFMDDRTLFESFLRAGAKYFITGSTSVADTMIIPGVNHHLFNPSTHKIVSVGDSASNCVIPIATIVEESFGKGSVVGALVVGVHSRGANQQLGDKGVSPLQEGLLDNLILASDIEASNALAGFFPSVENVMDAFSVRTPVEKGSLLVIMLQVRGAGRMTKDCLRNIFHCAAQSNRWRGIVKYDFNYSGSKVYQKSTAGAEIIGKLLNVWSNLQMTDFATLIIPAACSGMCGYGWQVKRLIQVIGQHL